MLSGGVPGAVTLYYVAAPASSVYGSPIPPLNGTVIGFLPGDSLATATTGTLDFTTTATSTSSVGNYAITGSGLTAIGNYVFAQDAANATALSVTPAPLTITADDASKLLGTALSFAGTEFSSSGLVNSDAVTSVSLSSLGASALATTAGNPYPITPSNAVGTGLSNYTISYVDGALTVTNVPIPPAAQRPLNDPTASAQLSALTSPFDFPAAGSTPQQVLVGLDVSSLLAAGTAIAGNYVHEVRNYTLFLPPPPQVNPTLANILLSYAVLARDAGSDTITTGPLFGYKPAVDPTTGQPLTWQQVMGKSGLFGPDEIKRYEEGGFSARVYQNDSGEVVIAYRASVDLSSDRTTDRWQDDWNKTNFPQVSGQLTDQYSAGAKFADAVRSYLKPAPGMLTLVGHSKGGGQASYAADPTDKVVTFNGARNAAANSGLSRRQTNVIVVGDNVGDPSVVFPGGTGSLPGQYVSVKSTEPNTGPTSIAGNKITEHSLSGILGGLFDLTGTSH